jgi:hypothetical protein
VTGHRIVVHIREAIEGALAIGLLALLALLAWGSVIIIEATPFIVAGWVLIRVFG